MYPVGLHIHSCWRFGTIYRSHLQESVRNYHCLLRNNPEERISQLLRGRSLKSQSFPCCPHLLLDFDEIWCAGSAHTFPASWRSSQVRFHFSYWLQRNYSRGFHDGFKAQSALAKSVRDVTRCTICNCVLPVQNTVRYPTVHRPSKCPNLDNTEHW